MNSPLLCSNGCKVAVDHLRGAKVTETTMKLDNEERYTCFQARLYEEHYDRERILDFIRTLTCNGFNRILCCSHAKDNAKTHYHILAIGNQFRPSQIYKLGLSEFDCSDVQNRKGAYFYIKDHKGKEKEDKLNNHKIEVIYDTILYKEVNTGSKNACLSDFIESVDEILRESPYISKIGLLRRLQKINEAFLGFYLRYYRFVEELYGRALFELQPPKEIDVSDDDLPF